jgi:uncharacterized Ntn-hydrolase superfamily protein
VAPLISTYSIVGRDPLAREWGVAVQSRFLAVGAVVPYAEAEAGALATQALANLAYGRDGIELLRGGRSAGEVVERLIGADTERDHRQLGVVDRDGRSSSYTGAACREWAGGVAGPNFAAQGNTLESSATVEALAATFVSTPDSPLAQRLLECLRVAQAAGGDRRGQQAAALLVVRREGGYGGGSDRLVDLRVDDHAAPIDELSRLHGMHDLLFGTTPEEAWIETDAPLRVELSGRLVRLGYGQPDLELAFLDWAHSENLEQRVRGVDRIDPVVLGLLRAG